VFYRDGVAENQFAEVIDAEVAAIKGACEDIKAGWNPPLTFVVVQKRHNTRLFPNDNQNHVGGCPPAWRCWVHMCCATEPAWWCACVPVRVLWRRQAAGEWRVRHWPPVSAPLVLAPSGPSRCVGMPRAARLACVLAEYHTSPRHSSDSPAPPPSLQEKGNILPGTVVETDICHPVGFDFFLNSHAGLKGTNRPAHYHVLVDENGFGADGMQLFTYHMCYLYCRCTR
jgi:hypothetical protein